MSAYENQRAWRSRGRPLSGGSGAEALDRKRTVLLSQRQDAALVGVAERRGVTASEVVREALEDLLDREGVR